MALPAQKSLQEKAGADGAWYLAVSAIDYAGNWSEPSRIRFDRDRTPPPPPLIFPAATDDGGYLASNTFSLSWIVQDNPDGTRVDDVAGYTWELRYIGDLEASPTAGRATAARASPSSPPAKGEASARAGGSAPRAALPGLSSYEAGLVADAGPALPPPAILGTEATTAYRNVDNGYYLFSVAAIDGTGNIGPTASILIRANKYQPYTAVIYADSKRDEFGMTSVSITGRGYTAEGDVDEIVIDRDGREPYDLDRFLASGGYRVLSDRQIDGIKFEDLAAGSYRIGIHHTKRGWYWTGPVLSVDVSGTIKYGGAAAPYVPSWTLAKPRHYSFSIYDIIILIAVLFAGTGLLLSSRQAIVAARDVETIHQEVLALVSGGPMPTVVKAQKAHNLKRRGAGLRVKVTLTITSLVIFVVLLVSIPLGVSMIRSESASLASGLQERAFVLLESVSQGGRSYLPSQDILQLGFLPEQAKAMSDAVFITVTGYGSEASTDPDVVWATNDPDILKKIDTPTLQPGVSRLKDELSDKIPGMMGQINARAEGEVGDVSKALAALSLEGQALATKLDAASQRRLSEISASSRSYEQTISEKLFTIANSSIGSSPTFNADYAASKKGNYLFYKPILYRKGQDQLYYRGMVRLEVSTKTIVANVQAETQKLITRTALIAVIALALGFAGAFLLSSIIVVPIKKLVKAIETIRDEEDKEKLEGLVIEVASRDEIYTLADTLNQMTEGLAKAAKASKELIVGKGIQKMFIPLDPAPGSRAKLSTGHRDERGFEYFGYYEGAKGVSGDYWDFQSINSRYHYFIKCDISGKGVSAALIMVQVATMVINYFNEWKKAMPKRIDLTDLTYKINDFIEERHFVGRFAAFTLGVWDSEAGVAYLCEAGDRKLHVWDAQKRGLVEELLPDSPAAGPIASFLVEMKQPFIQVERRLGPNDVLFLYTDGIEEAKRHFRDASFKVVPCTDVEKDQPHENHSGMQDNEEFGYDRITQILEAVDSRGSYRLIKYHNPVKDEVLTFDFANCDGSLEEQVLSLIAVEKVFRMYPDPQADKKDFVLVDAKVDAFLEKHFDQYRLYCKNKSTYQDAQNENPGYMQYSGIREDDQYDDLTILAIKRK
jgi:serine phosphatase RsbU (regulator of sigma subunit)